MIILSLMVPFILWALMQFLIPWVMEWAMEKWSVDLKAYYPLAGTFFLMLIPMMMGMAYGFVLLDERDGGLITAISVTPTGKAGYLKLRLGIPMGLSILYILLYLWLLDFTTYRSTLQILAISWIISTQSLIMLLFLGAFAENKVMGMAISKGFGILLMGPLLDYLLPAPYQWIGSYSPFFWASRAMLTSQNTHFWLYTLATLLFHTLLLWILFHKFRARSD